MDGLPDAGGLETRARALYEAREYAGVAALLEAAPAEVVRGSSTLAFWLADSLRRIGRGGEARKLLGEADPTFARQGNTSIRRHRLNLEGMLSFERGDLGGAEEAWRRLLADASVASDDDFVARANNNLGVICTVQERWQEALACYERAAAAYRAIGRRRGLAQTHQNLGITYRELDFAPKSDHHFVQAIRYASADGSEDEVARAEQERALLIYLSRRDAQLARATAARARTRFELLGDGGGIADTLRVLGMIELGEGDLAAATRTLGDALRRARDAHMVLVEAELLEVLAGAVERRNDPELAAALRHDAARLFGEAGAAAWGMRTRRRVEQLAGLAAATGTAR